MNAGKVVDGLLRRSTGLSRKRIRQWRDVIRDEGRVIGGREVAKMAWAWVLGVLGHGTVPGRVWRERLRRGCLRCPVFDRTRWACRDRFGMQLGCGCFMPVKAWARKGACWARNADPMSRWGFD